MGQHVTLSEEKTLSILGPGDVLGPGQVLVVFGEYTLKTKKYSCEKCRPTLISSSDKCLRCKGKAKFVGYVWKTYKQGDTYWSDGGELDQSDKLVVVITSH